MTERQLVRDVRSVLQDAAVTYRGTAHEETFKALDAQADRPLRVAIAGRVKAGKSTLLNALVGERVAATDAGECTRVVTWYSDGVGYRVWLYPHGEEPHQVPFDRVDGTTTIDLDGYTPEQLTHMRVEFPSRRLRQMTLIDTPGIASLSTDVSERTTTFLAGDASDERADAVLYLMRHLHASDVHFLEAFNDQAFVGTAPVNAVGVLSRVDEIGSGRTDAIALSRRVAQHHRRDPRVRALVQTVVPVAGLLAQTASTLREAEYAAIATIAGAPLHVGDALLLSADSFAGEDAPVSVSADRRRELLERFGLFGVRLAVGLVRQRHVATATELARELLARSGLPELQSVLLSQFTQRSALIKAHRALRTVEDVATGDPRHGAQRLLARAEEIMASAHDFAELRLLNDLRTQPYDLSDDEREGMEMLLGVNGGSTRARLGLDADADVAEVRRALVDALRHWQLVAERAAATQERKHAARVLRRTCEGMFLDPELRGGGAG